MELLDGTKVTVFSALPLITRLRTVRLDNTGITAHGPTAYNTRILQIHMLNNCFLHGFGRSEAMFSFVCVLLFK